MEQIIIFEQHTRQPQKQPIRVAPSSLDSTSGSTSGRVRPVTQVTVANVNNPLAG